MKATAIYITNPFHQRANREVKAVTRRLRIATLDPAWKDKPYICLLNGKAVMRREWNKTTVESDDIITFLALPQGGGGGGSNPLRLVLMIAVMVFAPMIAPMLNGALGLGFAAGSVGMGILTAGVGMLGSMLVNALIPPPQANSALNNQNSAAASPTYSIGAQGNQGRLGQAIAVTYGRHQIYPDYAAPPYAEYSNNDQTLYELFCIGQGEFVFENIQIGDNTLAASPVIGGIQTAAGGSFPEVSYEIVPPGGTVTLFPSDVSTSPDVAGQELLHGTNLGPFMVCGSGVTVNQIAIDVVCPSGLFFANDSGGMDAMSVSFSVFYAPVAADGTVGSLSLLANESISAATNTPQRMSYRYAVGTGRYAVQVLRNDTKNTDARASHTIEWVGLRGYIPQTQTYGDVTMLATRMLATNNLSSQSSRKVNVTVTRKIPIWNHTTGYSANTPTNSIAWAALDILRNTTYGGKLSDAQIDLAKLEQLDAVWTARGDTFNAIYDSQIGFWEAMTQVCRAGRCVPIMQGGVVTFVRDAPQTIYTAMFTQRNMTKGSLNIEYIIPTDETTDAVEVEYFDSTIWKPQRVLCVLDGGTSNNPAKVQLFGVTNAAQAYREGMYMAAQNQWRRKIITFTTELEGHIPTYGDLVAISHDVPSWGTVGDVVSWDSTTRKIVTSEVLDWTIAGTPNIALRRLDGSLSGPYVASRGDTDSEVILASVPDFTPYTGTAKERTHFAFGMGSTYATPARIMNIRPHGDTVEVVAVNESGYVHSADAGVVPNPPPLWVLPKVSQLPTIASLSVTQGGTQSNPVLGVFWTIAPGADHYNIETSTDGVIYQRVKQTTGNSESITVSPGPIWVRVAAVAIGQGPYVVWSGTTGQIPPPPDVTGFAVEGDGQGPDFIFDWNATPRANSYTLEVWGGGQLVRSTSITATRFAYTAAMNAEDSAAAPVPGPWRNLTFKIRAVGQTGSSTNQATVTCGPTAPTVLTGLSLHNSTGAVFLSYNLPAARSFAGVLVYISTTTGFTPDPSNVCYEGADSTVVISKDATGTALANGTTYYIRAAAYDNFGKTGLTYTPEMSFSLSAPSATIPKVADLTALAALTATASEGDAVMVVSDGKLHRFTSGAWTTAVAGSDIFPSSVTSDKISVANLSAVSATTGNLTVGDGSVLINDSGVSSGGSIQVFNGTNAVANRDFALLTNGKLTFQRYRGGAYIEYKAVKRVDSGVAVSGASVTLPGYYDAQPSVQVAINSVQSFNAGNVTQSQSWNCRADNLQETTPGSGVWKFTAVAELTLSNSSGTQSVNSTSGDVSKSGSYWDSSVTALPTNTSTITVNVQVKSKRGTGAHTYEWQRRQVLWQIWTWNGISWANPASKTTDIGAAVDNVVSDSLSIGTLAAGVTQYFVRFYPQDAASGTFSTGADAITYGADTVTGSNGSVGYATAHGRLGSYYGVDQNGVTDSGNYGGFAKAVYHMPPYSPPAASAGQSAWTVYRVDYAYNWEGLGLSSSGTNEIEPNGNSHTGVGVTRTASGIWVAGQTTGVGYIPGSWPNQPSYNTEAVTLLSAQSTGQIWIKDVVATVYRYAIAINTTTSTDNFTVVSEYWAVSGYSAISTGTLNWIAIGE